MRRQYIEHIFNVYSTHSLRSHSPFLSIPISRDHSKYTRHSIGLTCVRCLALCAPHTIQFISFRTEWSSFRKIVYCWFCWFIAHVSHVSLFVSYFVCVCVLFHSFSCLFGVVSLMAIIVTSIIPVQAQTHTHCPSSIYIWFVIWFWKHRPAHRKNILQGTIHMTTM